MSKLSLYIVESLPSVEAPRMVLRLVIAEDASKAESYVAFQDNEPHETVIAVGRLGEYEPGIEGHQLVMRLTSSHKNGAFVLEERRL